MLATASLTLEQQMKVVLSLFGRTGNTALTLYGLYADRIAPPHQAALQAAVAEETSPGQVLEMLREHTLLFVRRPELLELLDRPRHPEMVETYFELLMVLRERVGLNLRKRLGGDPDLPAYLRMEKLALYAAKELADPAKLAVSARLDEENIRLRAEVAALAIELRRLRETGGGRRDQSTGYSAPLQMGQSAPPQWRPRGRRAVARTR